ncbi:hypothetical protein Leryth_023146, partial [Lithospermum erythrorhizon]
MAQQNQLMGLKRKLSTDFLKKEQAKGEPKIRGEHFQPQWWQREHLLLQYLALIFKLLTHKHEPNPLEHVLKDMEALGLDILGIEDPPKDAYTTIVTHALQCGLVPLHLVSFIPESVLLQLEKRLVLPNKVRNIP